MYPPTFCVHCSSSWMKSSMPKSRMTLFVSRSVSIASMSIVDGIVCVDWIFFFDVHTSSYICDVHHTCTYTLKLIVCSCKHFQLPRTLIQVDGNSCDIHWSCVFRFSHRILHIPVYHTHLFQPIPDRPQRHNQLKYVSEMTQLLVLSGRRVCPLNWSPGSFAQCKVRLN